MIGPPFSAIVSSPFADRKDHFRPAPRIGSRLAPASEACPWRRAASFDQGRAEHGGTATETRYSTQR